MDVVSVQDRPVEGVENRRPSDVFLALWRERVINAEIDVDEFAALADVWQQIREMEAIAARERRQILRCAQDDSEPVSDSVHPMTEGDGELAPQPAKKPRRSAKEIGADAFATRKRNILAALDAARADGISLGDISTGAAGLTLNDVMDIMDRKPKPVVTWTALEKALKKLGYPPSAQAGEGAEAEE